MEHGEMKRLYLEHRMVEEARDLDGVVATFDDDCFLENVALGTRATDRDAVRRSYESLFATFPDLSPESESEAYGSDVFVTWGMVRGTMSGAWFGIPPRRLAASPAPSSTSSLSGMVECRRSGSISISRRCAGEPVLPLTT
jgi:hypothetical protein